MPFSIPEEVVAYIEKEGVELVGVRFTDVSGTEQYFTIPASVLDGDTMTEGLAFDGSSVRSFTSIDESGAALLPDLDTMRIGPLHKVGTLDVRFFVYDPFTLEPFSHGPRNVAKKAKKYLIFTGIAGICFLGAETEFCVFDNIKFEADTNRGFYEVDSVED